MEAFDYTDKPLPPMSPHRPYRPSRWLAAIAAAACLAAAARAELPDPVRFSAAIEAGDIGAARAWLDEGLYPNFIGDRIGTGLMIAAWEGNIEMMELFVSRGAAVNWANDRDEQALMFAAWRGRLEAVRWLLDRGAQINRKGLEWSAIHYAAFAGHEDVLRLLIDRVADVFEIVCDGWEVSGDYHEYAFGSKFDRDGNIWVVLCLTGSFTSEVRYRGWCVRVTPDGTLIPTCSGIRSPGGIGRNAAGDTFYTDNQGPWNGTSALKHLIPGKFVGHPGGFRWYDIAEGAMGKRPVEPQSGSRFVAEAKKIPEYEPPAILFPYAKMGQSASGIACDTTGGKFGPFAGQVFVGDQTFSTVMRCYLEQAQGHYQGACFPFREGLGSGTVPVEIAPGGSMLVGGTNRGWGSRGNKPFALERLDWTGKIPFEIHEMRAKPDGFELTFTQPVDPETAGKPDSYKLSTYTYIFQSNYGSPEVDHTTPAIESATVSDDRRSVRLKLSAVQEGHVHELHADGVRSSEGLPLLHPEAYYTLNYVPAE
jgi:hypothetical protein